MNFLRFILVAIATCLATAGCTPIPGAGGGATSTGGETSAASDDTVEVRAEPISPVSFRRPTSWIDAQGTFVGSKSLVGGGDYLENDLLVAALDRAEPTAFAVYASSIELVIPGRELADLDKGWDTLPLDLDRPAKARYLKEDPGVAVLVGTDADTAPTSGSRYRAYFRRTSMPEEGPVWLKVLSVRHARGIDVKDFDQAAASTRIHPELFEEGLEELEELDDGQ